MEKQLEEQIQFANDCLREARECVFSNRYKEAEEVALRAKSAAYDCKKYNLYIDSLNLLGVIYNFFGRFDRCVECLIEGLDIALDNGIYASAAIIYNNLGSYYQNFNAYEKAEKMFIKSKEYTDMCDIENMNGFIDTVNMNFGIIKLKLGDYNGALEYLSKLDERHEASKRPDYLYSKLAFKCLVMWKCGKEDYVREHLDELVEMAVAGESIDFQENINVVVELLCLMGEADKLKRVLTETEKLFENENDFITLELSEMWLRYYNLINDRDGYLRECEKYVNSSRRQRENEKIVRAQVIDTMMGLHESEREKSHAESLSNVDPLTGVGSRNKLLSDSKEIIEKSIMEHLPVGIGLIDVDFFKECNDTYGHIAGDKCLKKVADIILAAVDQKGKVYRFGGDEFLIVIFNAKKEELESIGEKIQKDVAAAAIPNSGSKISRCVTVSQGYTKAIAENGDSIEKLIDMGDKVLYQVKRYGRNGYRFLNIADVFQMED